MKPTVVIADDDPVFRDGMADIVRDGSSGFELAGVAADGLEALELVREKRPSLLLTDICMPMMDGIALVEELRRSGDETRTVILTGHDDAAYARAALRFGVRDYLLKPLTPWDFRSFLASMKEELDREALVAKDMEELKARALASLPAARERRIRELLEGRTTSDPERETLLGLDLGGKAFCAAILRFPRAEELDIQWLIEAIPAAFASGLDAYAATIAADTMALLLVDRTGDPRRSFLAASSAGRRLRQAASERLGSPVSFALGALKEDRSGIEESYEEAREALASVFSSREGKLVAYGDIAIEPLRDEGGARGACKASEACFAAAKAVDGSALVAAAKLGSPDDAAKAARELVRDLASVSGGGEESLKSRAIAAFASLDLAIPEGAERPKPPIVRAVEASTLGELADIAGEYAAACARAIDRSRAGRAADLVERARIIAQRQMADEALSLDDVAAELYVSPSHLRHVFKRQAGLSFGDFLSALRLDAADRLLADRDLLVQEIARRVGYSEQRYFSSCYKRKFGITPSERRASTATSAATRSS